MVREIIYKMPYCTYIILVSSSRFLPAVQQIPLLRGHWSASGDPPVIVCKTKFVKHLAMSGRRSRCGVSFSLWFMASSHLVYGFFLSFGFWFVAGSSHTVWLSLFVGVW